MNPKILIIGGNSFSGSYFINYLRENNFNEIHSISRSEEPILPLAPHKWPKEGSYIFKKFHLVDDFELLDSYIKKTKPNLVFNFAAQSMVAQSWSTPEDWFMTNSVGFAKLLSSINKLDSLDKYIHISTPEVYGNCEGSVSENYPFNPTTPYASSRAAADMLLKNYNDAYNFPSITTRAANVYGPGQQLYRIIPKTIFSILKKEKLNLHGGGVSTRSFIHMKDVSDATLQLGLKKDLFGETFHISTNEFISIRDLVELICKKMNVSFNDYVEIGDERLGKDLNYQLSSKKLIEELRWKPEISIDKGVAETINWLNSNFSVLKNTDAFYKHKK
jgi:dTDP-glucose 4,6-dehydratase